jgi:hypothetical protein
MDTESKRQYMETIREEYLRANKKKKGEILDEYCERTGEERKYAIKKFRYKVTIKKPEERKKRSQEYKSSTIATLVELWNIFDHPCGQRLKPLLEDETQKLRALKEITCTDEIVAQLQKISSATIDRRLTHEKEVLALNLKYKKKRDMTLLSQVPMKTAADLDKDKPGTVQVDCVEHCGVSVAGEYVHSLTTVDMLFGWWEGEGIMGQGQERALIGIKNCQKRTPVCWREIHPDNGGNILNWHVYKFAENESIELSRSRPYKKNDNCYVEQKNSTHVRRQFGYLRFDTKEEMEIMNDLYRNELRLYKNFFQPVMKLTEKTRVKGKSHRKYDKAQTPYRRIIACDKVSKEVKETLTAEYETLNPAELKRHIDVKVRKLYTIYQDKKSSKKVETKEKLSVAMVSNYMIQQL